MIDSQNNAPWQQSTGALLFLGILGISALVWIWITSLPHVIAGHQGAVELLLVSYGIAAFGISVLGAGYKKPKVLIYGASMWAIVFYLSSLFLDELIKGHNIGTAIRVGALSVLSFALAAAYLMRKLSADMGLGGKE